MNTASYGLLPGDFVPITWFCTIPVLLPDDVVQCLYHVIMVGVYDTKWMMIIIWLLHTKYIKHT